MSRIRIVCRPERPVCPESDPHYPIVNGPIPTWADLQFFIDDKPVDNVQGIELRFVPNTDIVTAKVEFLDVELDIEAAIEAGYVRPVPMILYCPKCNGRHIDEGVFETKIHHTHACQHCGHTWRPAVVPTVGVEHLPGFKNESEP